MLKTTEAAFGNLTPDVARARKAPPGKAPKFGWLRRVARKVGRVFGWAVLGVASWTLLLTVVGVVETPISRPAGAPIVNDITRLDPIPVQSVITPTTVDQIVAAVRTHPGPISVGGGRYSMGGQTATTGGLQIDMRGFNRVLAFDSLGKVITVQPGIRWRQIQERIDPSNLSVKIMQTYANFTVGGSMSVNVHGRYIGLGPLALSVRSLKLVLADGRLVEASATKNPELFFGAIGGYGGLGVIVEATLDLADNVHVKRQREVVPVSEYKRFFFRNIRDSADVIFHNGDIFPDDFTTVSAVSYVRTNDSVTVKDRLMPKDKSYALNRAVYSIISEWPFGKAFRAHIVEPLIYRGNRVEWRNYEASYDVADLEPSSRERSTYVLQEYFIPVENFDAFVPKMRAVFHKHHVNVINVSIRHAKADPGTLLAWAPREAFAFVVYYKQGTDQASRRKVGVWTREMTDSILSVQGSYYLPYQPWATEDQFLRAYPRAPEFFALKHRVDPTNKFSNTLWDRYYLPRVHPEFAPLTASARARLDSTRDYSRDEGQTFLTHPEWYIVYSSDEYAGWLGHKLPTSFPYAKAIGQYWVDYWQATLETRDEYPFNAGYHVMLGVIGVSYSVELALKSAYENTIGRISGWTAGGQLTDEDRYAATVAADYGRFIHIYPWYQYGFSSKLRHLWGDLPLWGAHPIRKWERRVFLTAEYGIKALYGSAITAGTHAAYAPEAEHVGVVAARWSDSLASKYPTIKTVGRADAGHMLLDVPRYDAFRDLMIALSRAPNAPHLTEIAGNETIFLTGVAPAGWAIADPRAAVMYEVPLPTDPARKRITMRLRVPDLLPVLQAYQGRNGLVIDHIYDY